MSVIATTLQSMEFNRHRTLGLLDQALECGDESLGWRPGPGRAHIAWQLAHVGVTEELFATERLRPERSGAFPDLWERFRGGSTPDDDIPSADQIRELLATSRREIQETLETFGEEDLERIVFPQREWALRTVLQVLCWHEGHHQGQAHLTLNLFKNRS